jgi:aminoglycoside phosphotransferase (APT) family kinase protein
MSDTDALGLVDQDRLAEVVGRMARLADDIEVEVLSGGQSNLTYLVTSGPYEYVARRRPLGTVAAGAHDMKREYRVLRGLGGSGLPIPEVYGFCDDERVVGAPFYLMSRMRGSVLHGPADVAGLDPGQGREISLACVDVLIRLHATDYDGAGLGDLGRPEGFVSRRISRWTQQWEASAHRDHPQLAPLGKQLLAQVPPQTDSTLVHGDFRLGNMMIDIGEPVSVAAVLDWEMSTLGDPLTDLAHLLVYWEPTRGRRTHESQEIAEHPGFLSGAELAERYAGTSGRDVSDLDFYLAFEHWRAAIIKEGIYMRRQSAGVHDEGSETLGDSVALHLAEVADLLG